MNEHAQMEQAAAQLRKAGFPFVQMDVRLSGIGKRQLRADVVAWDVDDEGELHPRVLVEVKSIAKKPSAASVIQQLSGYANVLGTNENYLFNEEGWQKVNDAYDAFETAECPTPSENQHTGAWPTELVHKVVASAAWQLADRLRDEVNVDQMMAATIERMTSGDESMPELNQLAAESQGRRAIVREVFQVFGESGSRTRTRFEHHRPWALASAMARLAGPSSGQVVFDPCCSLGTCLWAAAAECGGTILRGMDRNRQTLDLARRLSNFGGYEAQLSAGDPLGRDHPPADLIVTMPPFGLRLNESKELGGGGRSRKADVVFLDQLPQWLKPGGRAVVAMAPGVLFQGGPMKKARAALMEQLRVVSVVSLPAGLLQYTAIPLALIVVEKSAPTETLIARLGDDWCEQLSDTGEFMAAFRSHAARQQP